MYYATYVFYHKHIRLSKEKAGNFSKTDSAQPALSALSFMCKNDGRNAVVIFLFLALSEDAAFVFDFVTDALCVSTESFLLSRAQILRNCYTDVDELVASAA